MTHNRRRQMQTYASEEQHEHRCPFHCLHYRPHKYFLPETMTQHRECEGRENVEDHGHADEDLPRCEVELIDVVIKPTNYKVVGEG